MSGVAVPPRPPVRGDWKPRHAARLGESYDSAYVSLGAAGSAAAAGYLHTARVFIEELVPVTNLHFHVNVAGATLTSGQCKGFVYSAGGVLLAQTADLSTTLTSTGFKTLPLTAESGQSLIFASQEGWVHCGLLVNGTTMPAVVGIGNVAGVEGMAYGLTSGALYRTAHGGAGHTSVPATRPALTQDTGRQWWMGLS